MSMSHDTPPSPDDIQFTLQEVRTLLLQQILATETGLLSVAELRYRNRGEDDIREENIRYHLREMVSRDIVAKRKVPNGQRVRDLPTTFFGVTDYGEAILEQANLLAEAELWAEVYDQMERTEEIDRIERLKRQTWDRSGETESDDDSTGQSLVHPVESPVRVVQTSSAPEADACGTERDLYAEDADIESADHEQKSSTTDAEDDLPVLTASDTDEA